DLVAGVHATAHFGAAAVAGDDPDLHRLAAAVHQPVQGGAGRIERRGERGVPARALPLVEGPGEAGEVLLHALEHALADLRAHRRIRGTGAHGHARRPTRATGRPRAIARTRRLGALALRGNGRVERGALGRVQVE